MKGKILCTAMLLTSLMTFPAFAKDIHAEIENANKENIEEIMSYSWNEINGQKQFVDQTGKAMTGKFYDENGEIYDTGSSENSYIIQNGYNSKKEYFDGSGKLVNRSNMNVEEFFSVAERLENGEEVIFSSKNEYNDFMSYYKTQYRVSSPNVSSSSKFDQETGEVLLELLNPEPYNRELAVKDILKKFGSVSGNDVYDLILNACNKVKDIKTDNQYAYLQMEDAIEEKSASPWHICKIVSILLEDAGLENELVSGKFNGTQHYWLRCNNEGQWIYVDPTFYLTGYTSFLNIDYDSYISSYQVS